MSHSKYTASERRGIIAVAIIALLLIGGGITISLMKREVAEPKEIPVVVEHSEMVDTTFNENKKKKVSKKKSRTTDRTLKKDLKKQYRRRSPLDEPV